MWQPQDSCSGAHQEESHQLSSSLGISQFWLVLMHFGVKE